MDWLARLHPHAALAASAARPVLPPRFADAGPAPLRQPAPGQAHLDAPAAAPATPQPPLAAPAAEPPAAARPWASAALAPSHPAGAQDAAPGWRAVAQAATVSATATATATATASAPPGLSSAGPLQRGTAPAADPKATTSHPPGPFSPLVRPTLAPTPATGQTAAHPSGSPPATEAAPLGRARAAVPSAPLQQLLPLAAGPAAAAGDTPWVVQVHIQHLEVRSPATSSRRTAPAPRAAPPAGVSLADYLRSHGLARRESS